MRIYVVYCWVLYREGKRLMGVIVMGAVDEGCWWPVVVDGDRYILMGAVGGR